MSGPRYCCKGRSAQLQHDLPLYLKEGNVSRMSDEVESRSVKEYLNVKMCVCGSTQHILHTALL